jgi:hypothetical protein
VRKPGFRDAWIALKLYELRREGTFGEAREAMQECLSLPYDEIRPMLEFDHPKNDCLRRAEGYWEMAASFVLRDLLHPDVYLDTCDEGLYAYAVLEEHLPRLRETWPTLFARTESMVQSHPRVKGRLMEVRARIFRAKDRRP